MWSTVGDAQEKSVRKVPRGQEASRKRDLDLETSSVMILRTRHLYKGYSVLLTSRLRFVQYKHHRMSCRGASGARIIRPSPPTVLQSRDDKDSARKRKPLGNVHRGKGDCSNHVPMPPALSYAPHGSPSGPCAHHRLVSVISPNSLS